MTECQSVSGCSIEVGHDTEGRKKKKGPKAAAHRQGGGAGGRRVSGRDQARGVWRIPSWQAVILYTGIGRSAAVDLT